jgi:hypothetical protein
MQTRLRQEFVFVRMNGDAQKAVNKNQTSDRHHSIIRRSILRSTYLQTKAYGDGEAQDDDEPRQGIQQTSAAVLEHFRLAWEKLTGMT